MAQVFETLSGAQATRIQGKSQQNLLEGSAKAKRSQAESEELRAGFNTLQQAKQAARERSTAIAGIGEAGGTGTAVSLDILGEQAIEADLENALLGFEGEVKAGGLRTDALFDIAQGKAVRAASKAAARSQNIQFGIQLAMLGIGLGGLGGGASSAGGATGGSSFGATGGGFSNPNIGGSGVQSFGR